MPFLTLKDGDRLYYETHGKGPPLALVSGLGGTLSFWDPNVKALAKKFRVILHDHRGTGRSSRRLIAFSVDQMADDLLQLLDHLKLKQVDLIGHSTGGAIGQTIALDQPRRLNRLVLSATWTAPDQYFHRLFDLRADVLRLQGPLAYVQGTSLFGLPAAFLRDHARMLADEEHAVAAAMSPEIVLARIAAIQRFDRRAEIARIAAPTLVFAARDDLITPAYFSEALAHAIPHARLVLLPEGGHFYPRVVPDIFQKTVIEFLTET
jgi:aminoacrylate hydrolase